MKISQMMICSLVILERYVGLEFSIAKNKD